MTYSKQSTVFFLALLSTIPLGACSIQKKAASVTAQVMSSGFSAVEEEQDVAFANQASLPSLKMLEALQKANPDNSDILFALTRAYPAYTFGFVENDILEAKGVNELYEKAATDRAKLFYGRGKKFGLQLLSKKDSFKKALEGSLDDFQKALKQFDKNDVPALFWTAFNWGSYVNFSKDSPDSIIELPKIEAMMNRVKELDDTYYYAGPHSFFGVFYAARPAMLGGKPDQSKQEFEKAIELTEGKHLMTRVMYAQFYAVQTQNKVLFENVLKEVIEADPAQLPEQRLANELAQRRARVLLQKEKMFF